MKKTVSTVLKNRVYTKREREREEDNINVLFDRKIEIATDILATIRV
jgi:hypothetical protein